VREVTFLGHADIPPDAWGSGVVMDEASLIAALAPIIQKSDPLLILTHGPLGGYGHPTHRAVYRCVMAAARQVSYGGSIFSFAGQVKGAFFSWHFDEPSDVLINVRDFLARRVASLSYHQSQSEFFLRPYFPRTLRSIVSASFRVLCALTEDGRKRIPIITPTRFFNRFPVEGFVSHSKERPNFFVENFRNDRHVRIVS
jgi:LmbE family N-acetylglucosaminyl deacetylase